MRRASAGRRRLNSADSTGEPHATPEKSLRSRSQERILSVRCSIAPENYDEAIHSNASSTAGSDLGDMLEDLDPLENGHSPQAASLLGSGVVNGHGNHQNVVLTSSSPKKHKVPPNSAKYHRRSASDPFDVSGLEGGGEDNTANNPAAANGEAAPHSFPTLPRYPVAETRDLNCWSEPKVDVFKVRGKNYLKDKKKVPSEEYLFRARGCDLLLFPSEGGGDAVSMMDR
jgi:Protein ENHANCED DISEASE RESISTANCE 2, C-terminal